MRKGLEGTEKYAFLSMVVQGIYRYFYITAPELSVDQSFDLLIYWIDRSQRYWYSTRSPTHHHTRVSPMIIPSPLISRSPMMYSSFWGLEKEGDSNLAFLFT